MANVKRQLSVSIDEQSDEDIHVPAAKRRLVESSVNNKTVIDLTMDLPSSPAPSGSIRDAIAVRGSSPLAYGREGEEEEVRTVSLIPVLGLSLIIYSWIDLRAISNVVLMISGRQLTRLKNE